MSTRLRDATALVCAALGLLLLAAALPGLTFAPNRPLTDLLGLINAPAVGGGPTGGFPLLRYMVLLFWLLLAVAVVISLIVPSLRRFLFTRIALLLVFLLVAGVLFDTLGPLVAGGGAGIGSSAEAPPAPPNDTPPAATGSRPLPAAGAPPGWLSTLVGALAAAGLAALAIWVARRRRPARAAPDARELLADEAQQAIVALQRGADLRSTVLACYESMCRVLRQEQGLVVDTTMTAREFELLLAKAGVDDGAVHRLSRLFERVRYGRGAPDAAAAQEAEFCLQAVVAAHGSRT